jgi:hypothetical protein
MGALIILLLLLTLAGTGWRWAADSRQSSHPGDRYWW